MAITWLDGTGSFAESIIDLRKDGLKRNSSK